MGRYSTILFDVGGTLLRFNLDLLARAYVDAAAPLGLTLDFSQARGVVATLERELPTRQQRRPISLEEGNGQVFWDEFYADGFRRLGVKADTSAAAAGIRERFQRAEFEMLFDDVLPALQALKARGLTLGILSNFSANLENILRQVGVHQYFTFFVVSAIAGVEKPDPQIFELAVRAANRPRAEIVYIGDSIFHDVEGAQQAGIAAILVDRQNQHVDWKGARVRDLHELIQHLESNYANST
jgi:putative hydrolase of the HAD superfamily